MTEIYQYIGDAVYVAYDGYHIALRLNHHENDTNQIVLDSYVMKALIQFNEKKDELFNDAKARETDSN